MSHEYNAKMRCDKCNEETIHIYLARNDWQCVKCKHRHELSDALSDIVKAAEGRLKREANE